MNIGKTPIRVSRGVGEVLCVLRRLYTDPLLRRLNPADVEDPVSETHRQGLDVHGPPSGLRVEQWSSMGESPQDLWSL